jgi:AcrR family transcriptional regulator
MARPLSQIARQKALDAAQAVVAELGINGFTVDGVARRSGVAKTTLYRHWKTGTALLVSAIDCSTGEAIATPDTGSLEADLTELLAVVIETLGTPPRRRLLLEMALAATRDPELAGLKQAMVRERTRPVRLVVQQAIDRGEIPPVDLQLAATFIQGPVLAWVLDGSAPPNQAHIGQVASLLARGLGAGADG